MIYTFRHPIRGFGWDGGFFFPDKALQSLHACCSHLAKKGKGSVEIGQDRKLGNLLQDNSDLLIILRQNYGPIGV